MGDDIFTTGDLIVVTSGSYSSYGISRMVRALRDFTKDDIEQLDGAFTPPRDRWDDGYIHVDVLIKAGWIEELSSRELWKGDN